MRKIFLICLLNLSLFGCGGGNTGASNVSGNSTPVDSGLLFSPSTLKLTKYAGESFGISVSATVTRDLSGPINVNITDDTGVILPKVQVTLTDKRSAKAEFISNPALPAGVYDGKLKVSLCKDDPIICNQPH